MIGGLSAPLCLNVLLVTHLSALSRRTIRIRRLCSGTIILYSLMMFISAGKLKISSNGAQSRSLFRLVLSISISLITSADRRLAVEQIKNHPFFAGVDWDVIRQVDAPFVPQLRSATDTSYFPTDELDQAPEELAENDGGTSKDLAFLGLVNSDPVTTASSD